MSAADPIRQFADKIARQAKADPRKATVLGVLVAVLAFMWVRVLVGSGPASASANVTGGSTGSAFAATTPDGVRAPGGRQTAAAAALQEWARDHAVVPLTRNLFVTGYDAFPLDGGRTTATAPTEPTVRVERGDGFWDQLAKSMADRADQIKEHRARVENIRSQAAKLRVQSTLMGASPKALVNGELVGVGDVVASFRVSKIEPRRIVVEREGIKLEIRFN